MSTKESMYNRPSYVYVMYNKLLTHSECTIELESTIQSSAIEIANYGNGETVAVECVKCNEVIIDFDRPIYGGE